MNGQMTIFDYIPTEDEEEQLARQVGSQIGVEFKYIPFEENKYNIGRGEWVGKYKCLKLTIGYDINCDGEKYIGADWDNKKTHAGGGAPCGSIEEAVEYFNRLIHRELKPKIEQACTTCTHYKTIVDATTCEPLHKVCHKPGTCYGDMISDPDTHCCEYWEEKQCE